MKKITILTGIFTITLAVSTASFAFSFFDKEADKNEITNSVEQNVSLETVTLDLPGMFCATCPFTVRKSLEKLPGVGEVKTSLKTKTAIVKYDPKKVSIEKMIKATTDAGYPSTVKK